MKKIQSLLIAFAAASNVQASDQPSYEYYTQSGVGRWTSGSNSAGSSADNFSDRTSFAFTLPESSLNAGNPYDKDGSLTTVTNTDGSAMTDYEIWQADDLFSTGKVTSLTTLTVFAHLTQNTLGSGDFYLRITDSEGVAHTSTVGVITTGVTLDDPWDSSHKYTGKSSYDFDFSGVELIIGESYLVEFVDASGNLKGADIGITQYSDLGAVSGQPSWSPILQVRTHIPEPSTATLSLLALSGLLARRRRKQA